MTNDDLKMKVGKKILSIMESGVNPFKVPYTESNEADPEVYPINYSTGKVYSGINQYCLEPGYYLTFIQAKNLGGKVKKGAVSSKACYKNIIDKIISKDDVYDNKAILEEVQKNPNVKAFYRGKCHYYKDNGIWKKKAFYNKEFSIFNIKDIEGLKDLGRIIEKKEKVYPVADEIIDDYCKRENFEFVSKVDSSVDFETRKIVVPNRKLFTNDSDYYQVAFHTISESTSVALKRKVLKGTEEYSKEQLVNEIAGILCLASVGLSNKDCNANSGAYLKEWAKLIQGSNLEEKIWSAVTEALASYKLIFNIQKEEEKES